MTVLIGVLCEWIFAIELFNFPTCLYLTLSLISLRVNYIYLALYWFARDPLSVFFLVVLKKNNTSDDFF